MDGHGVLAGLGTSVIGAAVGGGIAYAARLPLLLGYITAGVVLGPHLGFGLIAGAEDIKALSEIGLILLMFILGLEIDLRLLLQAGKAVLINGVTQFVGCALLTAGAFHLFGGTTGPYDLIYLSIACSLSSTLIVVKLLSDDMQLDALTSRITLGILILQDLWAIGFLAIQPNLSDLQPAPLLLALIKAAGLIAAAFLCAKFLLPGLFRRIGRQSELMLIAAMAWCFAVCSLAGAFRLSLEMGALIAGVSIASFPYHTEIAAKVSSLRDFFIMLFFVAVGLQIPLPTASVLGLAAGIAGVALVTRVLTVFPVLYALGYGNRASLVPALNLSQVSEFALVLCALGVSYGHLRPEILSAFVIALTVTILISSLAIPRTHEISRFLNPLLERLGLRDHIGAAPESAAKKAEPTVFLLGFYREASSLLEELRQRHSESAMHELLVVDFNPEVHRKLKTMGIPCKYGDIGNIDTLRQLELERAKLVVCTIPDASLRGITNLELLRIVRPMAKNARIMMTAESTAAAARMYEEGADYVITPRIVIARYLSDVISRMTRGEADAMKTNGRAFVSDWKEILN